MFSFSDDDDDIGRAGEFSGSFEFARIAAEEAALLKGRGLDGLTGEGASLKTVKLRVAMVAKAYRLWFAIGSSEVARVSGKRLRGREIRV